MEEVVYFISVELLNIVNGKQTVEQRRGYKGTPYVKMEALTPDTESSSSDEKNNLGSENESSTRDINMTPRRRRIKGVDFPRCRRINFDLSENDEAKS
ncbi:hypothetical protein B5X24_HaOG210945 [Helicoverpa armigera]|nr:hypothetical protein B5X24_HaOG210945 [Helicoverpa armigera]